MKRSLPTTPGARRYRQARPGLLAAPLALTLLGGCYFLVDRDSDQCSNDGDCEGKGSAFEGFSCNAGTKVCELTDQSAISSYRGKPCTIDANCRDEGATPNNVVCPDSKVCTYVKPVRECQTNAECTQRLGEVAICRQPDRRCVAVKSPDCGPGEPLEALQDPNVIVLGTLLTNQGDYVESGLPIQRSVELAAIEISKNATGLPGGPGGAKRPIAFVFCNEGEDTARATRHLTDTLRVPAIIGASISDFTIDAANTVTIPSGVLLFSPGATSVSITSLQDRGLVWRTAPSDVVQTAALAKVGEALEQRIRNELDALPDPAPPAPEKLKIAVIGGDDAYGSGVANALVAQMQFNGAALSDTRVNDNNVFINRTFDFSDQLAASLRDELVDFEPHIVVLAGSSDVVTKIMGPVDDLLTFKPYYLLADGAFGDELSGVLLDKQASGLPARVRITAPGTSGATFNSFLSRYSARFSSVDGDEDGGTVFGAAGAYDATYLLALALSSIAPPNVSGASIAAALAKTANTTAGDVFDVQFNNDVGRYLTVMSNGGTINYTGASGPLDFDTALGEAQSDIQIFCADADDPATLNPTGQSYNALNKALEGVENCQLTARAPPLPGERGRG